MTPNSKNLEEQKRAYKEYWDKELERLIVEELAALDEEAEADKDAK